jgi:hypothetical protein
MSIDLKSRQALIDAHVEKEPVLLTGDGLPITFQTYVLATASDHIVLENRIGPEYIKRFRSSQGFIVQAQMTRFKSKSLKIDGQNLIFPIDDESVIGETRQSERLAFALEERVVAELLNPFDGETRVTKSVMDISANGLSLRTSFDSALFKPGVELPVLRIMIDGTLYRETKGTIVYNKRFVDLSGQLRIQVGVKFQDTEQRE